MFVITRRPGEALMIGEVAMTVLGVSRKSNTVRIGFDAPKSIRIDREEIHERKRASQGDANGNVT